jgi:hypothetical protein
MARKSKKKQDESSLGDFSVELIEEMIAENPEHYAELAKL